VRIKHLFAAAIIAALAGGLAWRYANRPHISESAGPPPVLVTAATAEAKDVPRAVSGLGTVQAFQTVAVRTRVDGPITKVFFTEGDEVAAGDPLFEIDPRPFQAALAQAEANKEKDEAQLKSAQLDLERYAKLVPQGWQSRQSYEQQQGTVGQLQGAVKADQAQIDLAKLNVDYATIRAPIAGRTGARLVDLGNFVQAGQNTSLVTIAQLKPIFVSFTLPQDSLDQIRQKQAGQELEVVAYANDDKTPLSRGKLTLIDNQVDVATGTIHLKATFDNGDERLWPGEFVNARLTLSVHRNAVTVAAQTIMEGPNGAYVYVIRPDNSVERRAVTVAQTQDALAVIDSGLGAGERVVVEGQYRLTQGSKVKIANAQQASLGADQR
jgi:membrane fusion protein, multidrug efflux system